MDVLNASVALSTFSDEPVYNVKAVCLRTGITAATLRAWERRYGLPTPDRTQHGYRLYSDRDIAILFWLKGQIENGVSIGQAVHQLANLLTVGGDPLVRIPPVGGTLAATGPRSPEVVARELADAIHVLDERQCEQLLTESMALYTLETTLLNVLRAALHSVHEQRRRGEIAISVERFALNFARQRLLHMIATTPNTREHRAVVTLGFPGDHNEIDLLIMGLLLRRHGWPVTHLGNELDPALLASALDRMNAGLILYYVDTVDNAERLVNFPMPRNPHGQTIPVAVAGPGVAHWAGATEFEYLGSDLRMILRTVMERVGDPTAPAKINLNPGMSGKTRRQGNQASRSNA